MSRKNIRTTTRTVLTDMGRRRQAALAELFRSAEQWLVKDFEDDELIEIHVEDFCTFMEAWARIRLGSEGKALMRLKRLDSVVRDRVPPIVWRFLEYAASGAVH